MSQPVVYPPHLATKDRVAVIAPAGPFDPKNLEQGEIFLKEMGFVAVHSENLHQQGDYLAGSDTQRAGDLNRAFSDKNIKGIFCARGGYGALRILPLIDKKIVRANPKVFLGFSDITALHCYFYKHFKMISFSGPMVAGTQINAITDEHKKHYEQLLTDSTYSGVIPGVGRTLKKGIATGRLLGGNLTLLVHCLAAGHLPDLTGAIVFIEDVNEAPYRIDRVLTTLLLSGVLDSVAGVVAGEFLGVGREIIDRILLDRLAPLNVPMICDFPIGHGTHNLAIPVGAMAKLDADQAEVELLEGAVC